MIDSPLPMTLLVLLTDLRAWFSSTLHYVGTVACRYGISTTFNLPLFCRLLTVQM
eukprot:IDg4246t1